MGISLFLTDDVSALRINEIMYNPSQDENFNEWIEIYNDENGNIDLTNYTLCGIVLLAGYIDKQTQELKMDEGLILESGQHAIITDGGEDSGTDVYENFEVNESSLAIHVDARTICGRLENGGETIIINDSGGTRVDEATYAGDAQDGYSLEFFNGNFVESSEIDGTPGSENSDHDIGGNGNNGNNNNTNNQTGENNNQNNNNDGNDEEQNETDSETTQDTGTNQEIQQLSDDNGNEKPNRQKISLNANANSKDGNRGADDDDKLFISKQEKLRMWVIYGFIAFSLILAILLAFKKL